MSTKENKKHEGLDNTHTKHKGESQQSHQKGAESVAKRQTGKHKKDDSDGSEHNTTKKGANSI